IEAILAFFANSNNYKIALITVVGFYPLTLSDFVPLIDGGSGSTFEAEGTLEAKGTVEGTVQRFVHKCLCPQSRAHSSSPMKESTKAQEATNSRKHSEVMKPRTHGSTRKSQSQKTSELRSHELRKQSNSDKLAFNYSYSECRFRRFVNDNYGFMEWTNLMGSCVTCEPSATSVRTSLGDPKWSNGHKPVVDLVAMDLMRAVLSAARRQRFFHGLTRCFVALWRPLHPLTL
ncbi:hypothetical protein KI387_013920, partial [Taxus chinensis]